jgi:hypothetical protein
MKFVEDRPYAKPEAAVRRLLEIANATDADQAKVDVGQVNIVFSARVVDRTSVAPASIG